MAQHIDQVHQERHRNEQESDRESWVEEQGQSSLAAKINV
jgi:hypothetical protein